MSGINNKYRARPTAISQTGAPTKIVGKQVVLGNANYSWTGSIDENFYTPITLWTSSINPVLIVGVQLYYDFQLIQLYDRSAFYYQEQLFSVQNGIITSIQ